MQIQKMIGSQESPEIILQRINQFMADTGYRTQPGLGTLVFSRGSFVGSVLSFSPRGWSVTVTARLAPAADQGTHIWLDWEINTTGQIVTKGEMDFWEHEALAVETAIRNGTLDTQSSQTLAKASQVQNYGIALAILVTAVFSSLFFRAAIAQKNWAIFFSLLVTGAVFFFLMKWQKTGR